MYGMYTRLDLHVWDSDLAVIRATRRKFNAPYRSMRSHREQRHSVYRDMLYYHHSAQGLCKQWRM